MSTPRTHIRNATLPDGTRSDVFLADGLIASIGQAPDGWQTETEIDAGGDWLLSSAIDLCARLGEPGWPEKATMASELPVAAAAGISVVCLPPDGRPVTDNASVVNWIKRHADAAGGAEVSILGALTDAHAGNQIAPLQSLVNAGCSGVAQANGLPTSTLILKRAMDYAAGNGITVHVRPLLRDLAARGCLHDGAQAARHGVDAQAASAETIAVATLIELARETGARLHIGRLSAAGSVGLLAAAKADGLAITADVAAHQLLLDESALQNLHPRWHLQPPLRTAADAAALRAGVLAGTIDAVCSDHNPQDDDAKTNPLPMTAPGGATVEHLWSATHTALGGDSDPATLQRVLCQAPGDILHRTSAAVASGQPANCLLFNPELSTFCDEHTLQSRGCHTPLHGTTLRGGVRLAWLAGIPQGVAG